MTLTKTHSLQDFTKDLRGAAIAEEWRGSWATALLYRVPGIYLAWFCARLRVAPLSVTVIAFVVALSLPVHAWTWSLAFAPWVVCAMAMLFQILDCTDGTLARGTGQTSKIGGDMDFLVDMAQWGLLYVSIGILADRTFDSGFTWTAIAAVAAWTRLMARVIRDRLHSAPKVDDAIGPATKIKLLDYPGVILGGISGLIPLLALTGSGLHWAVIALLIYGLLDITEGLVPLFQK